MFKLTAGVTNRIEIPTETSGNDLALHRSSRKCARVASDGMFVFCKKKLTLELVRRRPKVGTKNRWANTLFENLMSAQTWPETE